MTSLNRVILTGTVVTSPHRHYRPDGSPVIQFPLELNDSEDFSGTGLSRHSGRRGIRSRVEIVAFGELAESNLDLLQSGQPLIVIGRLNQRCWQTPEGRNRTCTEVIATSFRMVGRNDQTQKSAFRLTDSKVDGGSEVTLSNVKPSPSRQGFPPPEGLRKQGEENGK
ncbi:MAG TPA: single-stranded DNA-binding protein [Thermodesulfobacteriota bacterium]|nr:single-stranded DNA-binding protein [Thermodesulfobacteriota bacterium]